LSATVSGKSVSLKWADNSANEEGFFIEQGVQGRKSAQISYTRVGQAGPRATSYTLNAASGTFYFRVQAFNTAAPYSASNPRTSAYSNEVRARVR
jgi:hypothetical protein